MSRLVLPVVFAATLLGASGAQAAAPSPRTTVCGRSECLRLGARNESARILLASLADPYLVRSRPRPAPFYTVTIRFPDAQWSFRYVPSRHLMQNIASIGVAGPDSRERYWRTAPLLVNVAFETLSKRLRPFPAPRRWR